MKILPYSRLTGSRQDRSEQNAKTGLINFNRVLNRMLRQPSETMATEAVAANQATGTSLSADPKAMLVQRMGKVLTLLEGFRAQMANSATSLKELGPVAEKIESETNVLASTLNSLPAKGELARALKKTLIAAATDLARFRNGTYLKQNAQSALANRSGTV